MSKFRLWMDENDDVGGHWCTVAEYAHKTQNQKAVRCTQLNIWLDLSWLNFMIVKLER